MIENFPFSLIFNMRERGRGENALDATPIETMRNIAIFFPGLEWHTAKKLEPRYPFGAGSIVSQSGTGIFLPGWQMGIEILTP